MTTFFTKIFKGDIGRKLMLDAGEDISRASLVRLEHIKPDGTADYWAGSIDNQYGYYITQSADDLDQSGEWYIQLYVEMDGDKIRGKVASFYVYKTIDEYEE
jgi:hypothetical protein